MELVNLSNHTTLAHSLAEARSFLKRLKGLMFTKELPTGHGLHIQPCQSIHTFYMNYSIDVLYVNEQLVVVAMDLEMRPRKFGKLYKQAQSVIELPAGTIQHSRTKIGDKLNIKK